MTKIDIVREVMRRHDLDCGLLADQPGTLLASVGPFEAEEYRWLVNYGQPITAEYLAGMYGWLDGKLLPQSFAQGDRFALFTRLRAGILAVFCGQETTADVKVQFWRNRAIHETLEEALAE